MSCCRRPACASFCLARGPAPNEQSRDTPASERGGRELQHLRQTLVPGPALQTVPPAPHLRSEPTARRAARPLPPDFCVARSPDSHCIAAPRVAGGPAAPRLSCGPQDPAGRRIRGEGSRAPPASCAAVRLFLRDAAGGAVLSSVLLWVTPNRQLAEGASPAPQRMSLLPTVTRPKSHTRLLPCSPRARGIGGRNSSASSGVGAVRPPGHSGGRGARGRACWTQGQGQPGEDWGQPAWGQAEHMSQERTGLGHCGQGSEGLGP